MEESSASVHICVVCGQKFAQASSLSRHKDVHSTVRRFICDICGITYKHYASLKRHQRYHSGKLLYCVTCGRGFKQACNLKSHTYIHQNVKKHCCQICGKSFRQSGNLKSHERNVHQLCPYSCASCPSGFSRYCDLQQHAERTGCGLGLTLARKPDPSAPGSLKRTKLSRTVRHGGSNEKMIEILDPGYQPPLNGPVQQIIHGERTP